MPRDRNCATASCACLRQLGSTLRRHSCWVTRAALLESRRGVGVEGRTALIQAFHAILRIGDSRDGHRSRPYSEGSVDDDRPCSFLSWCFVSEVKFFGEMVLDAEFTAGALIRDSV
jgi:hypothetical protein